MDGNASARGGPAMTQARLSDTDILRTAAVITAVNEGMPSNIQEIGILLDLMRMLDPLFCIVHWPNGPAAIVRGNPAEQPMWNELLISTYRQGEDGKMGPVVTGVV